MYIEKDFVKAKCDAFKSGSKDYFYTYVQNIPHVKNYSENCLRKNLTNIPLVGH